MPAVQVLPFSLNRLLKDDNMNVKESFDVIIIGGSYAGLSAGLALGRSLRKVLIIDGGKPCNRQTPHSHNFLTQDGKAPGAISAEARRQVELYGTVKFYDGLATGGTKAAKGFEIATGSGDTFEAKKLIFATGVKDFMPEIVGFAQCWGISVLHCPYCHGYEVRNETTGILGNGEAGYELSKLISNWTQDLTLFTNGNAGLGKDQAKKLEKHGIKIVETEISSFTHAKGQIENIVFRDGSVQAVKAVYARVPFIQHSNIPAQLRCELTEQGLIKVDTLQKTSIPGVFACGDNSIIMRSVANAVSSGNFAGVMANKEMIEEAF